MSKYYRKHFQKNFLNTTGLAVDDIQAVQDNAILKRLAMQVELVLDVERLLPTIMLRRLTQQKVSIQFYIFSVFKPDFSDFFIVLVFDQYYLIVTLLTII